MVANYYKILEKSIESMIKFRNTRYLVNDLIPHLTKKTIGNNYLFTISEYNYFLDNEIVKKIFNNHRVLNNNQPIDINGYIYCGTFTDRTSNSCNIYKKIN